MKKRTLPSSLLIAAVLTIPSLAMAAPATNTTTAAQADMQAAAEMQAAQAASANNTLETQAAAANSEQGADQSNSFVINETQRISRASGNSITNTATSQVMPTDLQTQQQDMQQPGDIQLQTQQPDMQDPEADLLQEQDAQEVMIQEEEMAE
ncbi:hypothetical protein ACT3TH_05405 [Psychrobacter sp. AOP22-C1-C5]|uniref:hypothetical protein n=1 Tax=Psychrobacter sp. AOP22-C1-C5 TaxID=3457716 RepID=UPI0040353835